MYCSCEYNVKFIKHANNLCKINMQINKYIYKYRIIK